MLDAPSALALLKPRFGIDGFRAGQWEAIDAALRGHDSCVYLPTGSGKSLCFQATHPYHTLTPPDPTLPHHRRHSRLCTRLHHAGAHAPDLLEQGAQGVG